MTDIPVDEEYDGDIPEQPEVELDDEMQEWLASAQELRHADLERVGELEADNPEGLRFLEAADSIYDPETDGIECVHGEEALAIDFDEEEIRRFLDEPRAFEEARAVVSGTIPPGAVWRPFTNRSVSTTPLIGPRAFILHTMGVGTMLGSWSWHNSPTRPYTHGYYDGIGNRVYAQRCHLRAAGTLQGNPYVIAIETEDTGKWFPNGGRTCGTIPPWRQEQLLVFAKDIAWCCLRFGIPTVAMPDSCAGSRGIGYHRLGIYPWRKAGCLSYSNSNYKCCPDVARIGQIPALIREVARVVGGGGEDDVGTVNSIDANAQKQIKLLVHAAIREELPAAIKALWNHQIDMGEHNHPAEAVLRDARMIARRTEGVAQQTLEAVQALPDAPPPS